MDLIKIMKTNITKYDIYVWVGFALIVFSVIYNILGNIRTSAQLESQSELIIKGYKQDIKKLEDDRAQLMQEIQALQKQDTIYITKIKYIKERKKQQDSVILNQSDKETERTFQNNMKWIENEVKKNL